jgi:hypothetical protein
MFSVSTAKKDHKATESEKKAEYPFEIPAYTGMTCSEARVKTKVDVFLST